MATGTAADLRAPERDGVPPDEAPLVSVVIPTKEEAGNVGLDRKSTRLNSSH